MFTIYNNLSTVTESSCKKIAQRPVGYVCYLVQSSFINCKEEFDWVQKFQIIMQQHRTQELHNEPHYVLRPRQKIDETSFKRSISYNMILPLCEAISLCLDLSPHGVGLACEGNRVQEFYDMY